MPFRPSQKTFRGRDDSQVLNSSTFTYAVNTNWTQLVDTVFRVRFAVQEVGAVAGASTYNLYYSLNGGAYTKVTTVSTPIKYALSGKFVDKEATTKLLDGTGTWVNGQGLESSVDTDSISLAASGNTEIEFCLTIPAAGVAHGNTLALRVYRSTSTALYSYTNTPTITVSEPISGNLTKTLDNISTTILVAIDITSSLSKTLDNIILEAIGMVGGVEITGTLSVTLDALALNASGMVVVASSLDKILSGIGISITGVVNISNLFDKIFAGMALSGIGTAEISAVSNKILDNLSKIIDGVVSVSSISNTTLNGIGILASGTVPVLGTFENMLAGMSLSFAGAVGIVGNANKVLDTIGFLAFGTADSFIIYGYSDITLDTAVIESYGKVLVQGKLNNELEPLVIYGNVIIGTENPNKNVIASDMMIISSLFAIKMDSWHLRNIKVDSKMEHVPITSLHLQNIKTDSGIKHAPIDGMIYSLIKRKEKK